MQLSNKDNEFLKTYDASKYERPSVTVDMLIFTVDLKGNLELLLIKRKHSPYEGAWALPGGFLDVGKDVSIEAAAARELKEETNLEGIHMEQLYTFGDMGRDPRTRVISVAYIAMLPAGICATAGDDAAEAKWYGVYLDEDGALSFDKKTETPDMQREKADIKLAFDHEKIIRMAIERMRGKISYVPIALEFLRNKNRFSIYELQKVYEAVLGRGMDIPNFRRSFKSSFINTGLVEETDEICREFSRRPSKYYRCKNN